MSTANLNVNRSTVESGLPEPSPVQPGVAKDPVADFTVKETAGF